MFKLLFVFINLFMNIYSPYQEVVKGVTEKVIDERNGYVLYQEGDAVFLRHKAGTWSAELPKADLYQATIKDGNYLYLFSLDGSWELREYDFSGKLVTTKTLCLNPLNVEDVIYVKGLYLFGSINNYSDATFIEKRGERNGEDAIVLYYNENYELEDFQIYGGSLNECFLKVVEVQDSFFVVGRKDPEGGGDFGNGGLLQDSIFIAKLNKNLKLTDYYILASNSEVLDFIYHKDYLYLALRDRLYKFGIDLKISGKKNLEEDFLDAKMAVYNKYLFFGNGKIKIIDILDLTTKVLNSEYITSDTKINIFPDGIYLISPQENLSYDLVSLENFIILSEYNPEIETPKNVYSIFGKAELISEISEPFFDSQIHGVYEKSYDFKTPYDLNFTVKRNVTVPFRANVSNNGIYPNGYRLQFTGYAKLDGQNILNNHIVTKEGLHQLVLFDFTGNKTEINFYISKRQLNFTESSVAVWDFEAIVNEPIFLELMLMGLEDREIKGIIVNGEEKRNLLYTPTTGILTIPLGAENEVGIKHYYLERLLYLENGKLLSLPLNKFLTANILGTRPNFSLEQISAFEYEIALKDDYQVLRYLEVIVTNDKEEHRDIYPLGTGNINLPDLSFGAYRLEINLLYDPGNKQKEKLPLFVGKLNGGSEKLGEINILNKGQSLERFKLSFTNQVTELTSQDKLLYQKNTPQKVRNLLYGILGGGVSFSTISLFQLFKSRRTKRSA